MKEITRIHLAKVAYDIEVDAKKDIEKYIAGLERYADDPELLGDIEIRITELLAERGVVAGGVISKDDVVAVRERLGEPSDFTPEVENESVDAEAIDEPRRVYRDVDDALLGGVLAGFARFFGIDPLWVRLIFIVILIASFGTATIVYFILWLVIPPARTAAEKLRMSGKPVTLASIKQLGEQSQPVMNTSARALKSILVVGVGCVLTIMGIAALAITTTIGFGLSFGTTGNSPFIEYVPNSPWLWASLVLMVLSGVLFATLCFVLSQAVFRRRWEKRTTTAVVAIIAAGLVAFTSGVGVFMFGHMQERAYVDSLLKTSKATLPSEFSTVRTILVEADDTLQGIRRIEYVISDTPRWELKALPGFTPDITIAENADSATIRIKKTPGVTMHPYEYQESAVLKVYGPALEHVKVHNGINLSYQSETQRQITILAKEGSVTLWGVYDTVAATTEGGASVDAEEATINQLTIDNKSGVVTAGVVRDLSVVQPDACPAVYRSQYNNIATVRVQAISSGALQYNGQKHPTQTISNECGVVQIGESE